MDKDTNSESANGKQAPQRKPGRLASSAFSRQPKGLSLSAQAKQAIVQQQLLQWAVVVEVAVVVAVAVADGRMAV